MGGPVFMVGHFPKACTTGLPLDSMKPCQLCGWAHNAAHPLTIKEMFSVIFRNVHAGRGSLIY